MSFSADKQIKYCLWLGSISVALNVVVFFTICLWWNSAGEKPEVDTVAFGMSVLQTMLAVVALGGFWLLRGAAVEEARRTARDELERLKGSFERELRDLAEVTARRTAEEWCSVQGNIREDTSLADALDDGGTDE